MQTIEIWKRSVVVGAVFAILADIYFSRLHASYTNLVLTGPSIVAPSETEAAIAVQYLKPSTSWRRSSSALRAGALGIVIGLEAGGFIADLH